MSHLQTELDIFVEQVANALCAQGWRLPALIALEAGQPLTFLGGQLMWLAQPALSLLIPSHQVKQLAYLLEEPTAVQALINRLEGREG